VSAAVEALRFTEIMYHPKGDAAYADEDEFEFIELKNTGAAPLRLDGCRLDGVDFAFAPGTTVPAGGFVVLVANPAAFAARYPSVAIQGAYFRNLSNSGERLRLLNSDGTTTTSVEYSNDAPWLLGADGIGYSLVSRNHAADPDAPANWRASTHLHGSPGADDPAPPYSVGIVINEVLAKTNSPYEDAIELHNPTAAAIDISGWWLSDNASDPLLANPRDALKKYRIPAGTIVPAGGYAVFYEAQFNPAAPTADALVPFALSQDGDQVYLSSADATGNFTGHIIGQKFGASENNVSFGRIATSSSADFTALEAPTFGVSAPTSKTEFRTGTGAANALPRVGPAVINEIMYQPDVGGAEFIELCNPTGANVDLSGWTLEGAGLTLPAGTSIAPSGFLLVVDTTSTTVDQFRAAFAVPAAVPVLAALFDLGNGGETLDLKKPNTDPLRPAIRVDRVRYNDKAPWPTEAAGAGPSLERIAPLAYGNEPLHWRCTQTRGTPGRAAQLTSILATSERSKWKYHALGRDLGAAWRSAAYSDSAWPSGVGPLGVGHAGVVTVLPFGADANAKPATVYLRKEFAISEVPNNVQSLGLRANYGDGFVAYLNGSEVARRSIAAGAVTATTLASPHDAGAYETIDLTPHIATMVRGRNVLAVEVHLSSANDADLVWDAEVTYTVTAPTSAPAITAHPQGQTVAAGANVTFSAAATGTAPLSFQWLQNGAAVSGANGSSYTITSVQPLHEGSYSVIVSNTAGSATSNAATLIVDSDGDGLPDSWESANRLNQNDPADAALDADGDGQSNRAEYVAGTNPQSAADVLRATVTSMAGTPVIRFTAVAGKTYTIQHTSALADTTWTKLTDIAAQAVTGEVEAQDATATSEAQRFYRVVTPTMP